MVALSTYKACVAMVACAIGDKDRRTVSWTKRLETIELTIELVGNLRKVNLAIYIYLRNKDIRVDVCLHIVVETLGESCNILLLHRKSCGVHVTSEVLQQIGARLHSLVKVETCNRAS